MACPSNTYRRPLTIEQASVGGGWVTRGNTCSYLTVFHGGDSALHEELSRTEFAPGISNPHLNLGYTCGAVQFEFIASVGIFRVLDMVA